MDCLILYCYSELNRNRETCTKQPNTVIQQAIGKNSILNVFQYDRYVFPKFHLIP